MASSFGQYQNGIAPVSGIAEAGSNIGKNIQYGYAQFGQGLSEGIKQYTAGVQENEMLDAEAQGLAQQLKQYHDSFASNEEYAPFTKQLGGYVEKLAKMPEMSLAQKRGALNSAKIAFSNIGNQLQVFNQMKTLNEERAAADAMRPENNPTTEIVDKVLPMALDKFDWSKPYLGNESGFSTALDNLSKQGIDVDKSAKLEEYRKRVEEAATEMSKTNPMGLAIIDQVKAARKIDEATSPDVEGYSEAEQVVRTPATNEPSVSTGLGNLQYDIAKKLSDEKNKVNPIKSDLLLNANSQIDLIINKINTSTTKEQLGNSWLGMNKTLLRDIVPKEITIGKAGLIGDSKKVKEFLASPQGKAYSEIAPLLDRSYLLAQNIIDANKNALTEEDKLAAISALNKYRTQFNTKIKTENTSEEVTPEQILEKQGIDSTEKVLTNQLDLGTTDITVLKPEPVAPEIRNQRAIDFMTQRLGYRDSNGNLVTPASVNKIFGDMGTGGVKTINMPNGDRIVKVPNDKGGFDSHFVAAKEVTSEERRKAVAGSFGEINKETGKLQYAPIIPNAPFKYAGQWTGSEKELEKFKEINISGTMALTALDRLEVLVKNHPVALKNPISVEYKEAKSLIAQAYGGTKETLGLTGIMAKFKMDFLKDVLPDANSWLERPDQSLAKLAITRQKFGQYLSSNASVNGLKFNAPSKYLPPVIEGEGKANISSLKKELYK